jgi:hypothetical protein
VRWAARAKKPAGRSYCEGDDDRCGGLAVVSVDYSAEYQSNWWEATYLVCPYHLRQVFLDSSSLRFRWGGVTLSLAPGCEGWLPPGVADPERFFGVDVSDHVERRAGVPGAAEDWRPAVPPTRPTVPVRHSADYPEIKKGLGYWLTRPIGGSTGAEAPPWARRALAFYAGAIVISFALRATGIL